MNIEQISTVMKTYLQEHDLVLVNSSTSQLDSSSDAHVDGIARAVNHALKANDFENEITKECDVPYLANLAAASMVGA